MERLVSVIDPMPAIRDAIAATPEASDRAILIDVMTALKGFANPMTVATYIAHERGASEGSIAGNVVRELTTPIKINGTWAGKCQT